MSNQGIGARIPRKEDRRFITGQGNYTCRIKARQQQCQPVKCSLDQDD